jgi:chemotaxis-related protein WspD
LDEVAVQRPAHCLPHRRSAVVIGLVNVRGALLICVSLARLLGVIEGSAGPAQNPSATAAGRLVVLRHASGRLTFPADEVHGCHRYRSCDLQPPPATLATAATAYIKAVLMWSDRLVGLLDHQVVIPALIDSLA